MSFATLRMVHEGMRVIRLEATPRAEQAAAGDPNRHVGRPVAGDDRHAYFVAPNVGKEAIAVDLSREEGRRLLRRIVRELPVDAFCTNTLPARHGKLGIDHGTLSAERPDLVWCCISALGPEHPDTPGYDPMLQALCGYMDVTGHRDGTPLQCGPPLIDLKAGDEAFLQVMLALERRRRTGEGARIDVSMAQAAASWLLTFLPLLDMGSPPEELRRSGNEHRQFIPVNAYPTSDGWIYVAVGSDAQWARLVRQPLFAGLADPGLSTNEGRRTRGRELHARMAEITRGHSFDQLAAALSDAAVPHSPITAIEDVMELPFLKGRLLLSVAPDGRRVRLPPPAVGTGYLESRGGELPFAPAYGEHGDSVLAEAGLDPDEIAGLRSRGVVA